MYSEIKIGEITIWHSFVIKIFERAEAKALDFTGLDAEDDGESMYTQTFASK
jgi:hypothetical protein